MRRATVREARDSMSSLLDAVEAGDEVLITRRGRPVARLVPVQLHAEERPRFVSRAELRAQVPPARTPVEQDMAEIRRERLEP